MVRRVAVVGAGVIGLSTAVQVLEDIKDVQVTIIADKFTVDTTSDGAAGIVRPNWELVPGVPDDVMRQWSTDSYRWFDELAHSEIAKDAGVSLLTGYQFEKSPVRDPLIQEFAYHFRECTSADFAMWPGSRSGYRYGWAYTTPMVEGKWYLPYLMNRFVKNGGIVERRTVNSLEEFAGQYDVVVNASGMRARELVNDPKVRPIRGQMLRVKAPWVQHFVFSGDHDSWIVPGQETVVIGGTRQMDNDSLEVSAEESKDMLERACKMMPSLKKAEVLWTWVGLRPFREPVRLEKELMKFGGKQLKVVHNYGHGGNGVALSWGCATHATKLVHSHLLSAKL